MCISTSAAGSFSVPQHFLKTTWGWFFSRCSTFFLYDDKKANSKFEFDGLHEHLRLRLKDGTLLTSFNLSYIMYAFDCSEFVVNKMPHQSVFKRCLQTITIGKYKPNQLTSTESVLKMGRVDRDVHVNRLGTACASETPDLFVTFTCNKKEYPELLKLFRQFLNFMEPLRPKNWKKRCNLIWWSLLDARPPQLNFW